MRSLQLFVALGVLAAAGPADRVQAREPQTPQAAPATQAPSERVARYQQLVARVRSGDDTVDFIELMMASADRTAAERTVPEATRNALMAALEANDNRRAAQVAEILIAFEFTATAYHLGIAEIYNRLGDAEKESMHRAWADRIVRALLSTGDGQSPQTAYCVQSIEDEYSIMFRLGYEVTMQSLILSDRKTYDLLSGTDTATGKAVALHFDVGTPFAQCARSHQPKTG